MGAGAESHLSQALCPGDKVPLHKDLPGELVVRELFSSVLQEISDEVSEGGQDRVGGWEGGGRTCQNQPGSGLVGGSAGMRC